MTAAPARSRSLPTARRLCRGRRGQLRRAQALAVEGDPLPRSLDSDHARSIQLERGARLLEIDDEYALLPIARLERVDVAVEDQAAAIDDQDPRAEPLDVGEVM